MKPIEIVLKGDVGGKGRMIGGKLTKIYCKHICKYHNVSLLQLLYANQTIKSIHLYIAWTLVLCYFMYQLDQVKEWIHRQLINFVYGYVCESISDKISI
jgi:hypothetical protein